MLAAVRPIGIWYAVSVLHPSHDDDVPPLPEADLIRCFNLSLVPSRNGYKPTKA
jgi:hypothetical protein